MSIIEYAITREYALLAAPGRALTPDEMERLLVLRDCVEKYQKRRAA